MLCWAASTETSILRLRVIEETGEGMKVIQVRVLPDRKEKVYQWIGKK